METQFSEKHLLRRLFFFSKEWFWHIYGKSGVSVWTWLQALSSAHWCWIYLWVKTMCFYYRGSTVLLEIIFSLYTGNNCASHVVLTILQFLWEMSLEFWWESLRICRSCWECDHCYHNDSANLWPWDVFAASSVPSDFFLQCLKIVFVVGLLLFF